MATKCFLYKTDNDKARSRIRKHVLDENIKHRTIEFYWIITYEPIDRKKIEKWKNDIHEYEGIEDTDITGQMCYHKKD